MKIIKFTQHQRGKDAVSVEDDDLPYFHHSLHQHKEIQISLILKDDGLLTVGSYSQAYKSGDVYIIGANQPHFFKSNLLHDGSEKDAPAIHIYFDFKRIPETFFLLQELTSIRKFIAGCITGLQVAQGYQAQAAALIQTIPVKTNLERLLGLLELFQFFSNVVTGWKSLSTGFDNYIFSKSEGKRMNDIFKYTFDNYAERITLNEIASIAHITPHAFCKYFKQHTKKTYNNFLNEVRVNEACKKIISGSYDGLSSIAYKTGFKGASNFNRVFKRTTGMSPSDYRKEFRHKTA